MRPKILIFPNTAKLYQVLAKSWFEITRDSFQERGRFAVALSGGKTPKSFYRHLSKYRKNPLWQHTYLFIVDERFVNRTDKENNGRMISEILLGNIKIPSKNICFIDTHKKNPHDSANKYAKELRAFFCLKSNSMPKFDLILLGVGEDGHTASLFPGAKALKEKKRAVVSTLNPAGTQWRISLSLPAIKNARNVFFLVIGEKKAKIVRNILSGKDRLPAEMVYPKGWQVKFFMDKAAGAGVSINE